MNPRMLSRAIAAFALSASLVSAASAQNSAPQPVPIVSNIPEPQDRPLPEPMILSVDATDVDRSIFQVRQVIPVEKGKPLILLYPQWLILERNKRFEQIDIAYSGGLRYPHLEATGKGETAIDRLLRPRRTN